MYDLEKLVVMDIETDDLTDYTTIHVIVLSDLNGNETIIEDPVNRPDQRALLEETIKGRDISGHHFLGFDIHALKDLLGIEIDPRRVLDTLVMGRLLNYNIPGGHSIAAWGERVGIKKEGKDITDWSTYTPLMKTRCISDVRVSVAIIKRFQKYLEDPQWDAPIKTEHEVVWRVCNRMTGTGLPFDVKGAHGLQELLRARLQPIEDALQDDFPPRPSFIRTITPRTTLKGTLNAQDFRWASSNTFAYSEGSVTLIGPRDIGDIPDLSDFDGSPFDLYELVPFNPGSPKQVVTILNEAGWKPTDKTDGHIKFLRDRDKKRDPDKAAYYKEFGWKVNEENLKTLPDTAPESTKKLAQRLVLSSRLSDLEEWIALTKSDGRIHGKYNGIGAWTHRLSHNSPNTANIPVAKRSPKDNEFQKFVNDINDAMRALFVTPEGTRMVGTDADGIQMRIFAHLVGDQRLIDSLVNGSKENGTDIHTLHKGFLGAVCKSRDAAKTFIYAFLLGAGVAKVAEILECSNTEAKNAVANFLEAYPGLKVLKSKRIPEDAARGYFVGLDGRKVVCDSEHLMLSGYLQNGEKVIMARWISKWMDRAEEANIDYEFLNWVHDETQTALFEKDMVMFQEIQLQAMVDVGEDLEMKCPLKATTSDGLSWKETH